MKALDIRARMLLAALLPLVLISTLLAAWMMRTRFDDLQSAYEQRNQLVVRQLALASEYGLFSGNQPQLQTLAGGALHETDVRWVGILDRQGRLLASAGDQRMAALKDAAPGQTRGSLPPYQVDWLRLAVVPSATPLDDLFDGVGTSPAGATSAVGQVVVSFSHQALDDRKLNLLLGGGLIGALALVFGMVLALRLSQGVLQPVARISRLVEQIGRGEFEAVQAQRSAVTPDDPLYALQLRIHEMSNQLWHTRDDLQRQVEAATHELREKKDEAEAANLAKTRFLAAASHDLRQPTHALGLFVSRLAQLDHDAQTRQLIDHLESSVLALQNLLDGLLDISRLEAHAVQVNEGPFAVASLLDQLVQDLWDVAGTKGLVLQVRPSSAWVLSDATLVYRILLNLTNNAIRYTQHGRVLVVARVRQSLQQVDLQVWDTGIGIAPEHQQAVFSEFYQVANAARDRTQGLGLGLSIVQRTAELLGLTVRLKSRLGVGTCVTVTLPLVAAPEALPAQGRADSGAAQALDDVAVLVIEDDTLVRQALMAVLQGWGMRVADAPGLAQARRQLGAGFMPQVIISDFRLQDDVNGIEAIEVLRRDAQRPLPACLMSGDTLPGLAERAQQAGLSLLQKPVRPAKLRSLLRRLLV